MNISKLLTNNGQVKMTRIIIFLRLTINAYWPLFRLLKESIVSTFQLDPGQSVPIVGEDQTFWTTIGHSGADRGGRDRV